MTAPTKKRPFVFQTDTLLHAHLTQAREDLEHAIYGSSDISVIQVVGCSGVGKSHLIRSMMRKLMEEHKEDRQSDSAFIPATAFTVRSLQNRAFNWKNFYEDYLDALKHGEVKSKDLPLAREKIRNAHATRRPLAVFIDEAHHIIGRKTDPDSVFAQSEVIKSLTQEIGCKLVLVGTYDLLPLIRLNGQTSRRSDVVHFRRYDGKEPPAKSFRTVLQQLDLAWGHALEFKLADHHDEIYRYTLGLVGKLHTWLDKAQKRTHRAKKLDRSQSYYETRVTKDAFDRSRPKDADLLPLIEEATVGEHFLAEAPETASLVDRLLSGDREAVTELLLSRVPPQNAGSKKRKAHAGVLGRATSALARVLSR